MSEVPLYMWGMLSPDAENPSEGSGGANRLYALEVSEGRERGLY